MTPGAEPLMASDRFDRVARARSGPPGKLFAFGLDVGRNLFKRPFQTA